jgi:hypothetical protein
MYCSTCGSRVAEGRSACESCGAPVARPSGYGVPAVHGPAPVVAGSVTCPRCGFHGSGLGYFSRSGPLAGALLLALMTLPFMGAGGILFYALRHDYRICPRCGESWGKRGARALALRPQERSPAQMAMETEASFPADTGAPWGAWVLFVLAAILAMVGIAEVAAPALVMAVLAGAGGAHLMRSASRQREERRHALLAALQQPVLRLAGERGGKLTVTEVATAFSWPLPRAEKVLDSLEDGLRVASDVTDEGVIVYEFRELRHRRLDAPAMDAPPADPLLGVPGFFDRDEGSRR